MFMHGDDTWIAARKWQREMSQCLSCAWGSRAHHRCMPERNDNTRCHTFPRVPWGFANDTRDVTFFRLGWRRHSTLSMCARRKRQHEMSHFCLLVGHVGMKKACNPLSNRETRKHEILMMAIQLDAMPANYDITHWYEGEFAATQWREKLVMMIAYSMFINVGCTWCHLCRLLFPARLQGWIFLINWYRCMATRQLRISTWHRWITIWLLKHVCFADYYTTRLQGWTFLAT